MSWRFRPGREPPEEHANRDSISRLRVNRYNRAALHSASYAPPFDRTLGKCTAVSDRDAMRYVRKIILNYYYARSTRRGSGRLPGVPASVRTAMAAAVFHFTIDRHVRINNFGPETRTCQRIDSSSRVDSVPLIPRICNHTFYLKNYNFICTPRRPS